jgi:hypothetical protein
LLGAGFFGMQLFEGVRIQLDMNTTTLSISKEGNTMKTLKKLLFRLFVPRSLPDRRFITAGYHWFSDFRRWE